jgi:hypothetical protein
MLNDIRPPKQESHWVYFLSSGLLGRHKLCRPEYSDLFPIMGQSRNTASIVSSSYASSNTPKLR